jgi:hypothetical protein
MYWLDRRQAIILAENLRTFARGKFPELVPLLGPGDAWLEGALTTADWLETWLTEEPDEPFPLERGTATALAVHKALSLMHVAGTDAAGPRDALE